ncbi:MAG: septal ring lytic transglycosylase RlpA family protein [Deltaproteobacteria bacterium]|nr:septal ring lytic transglycosylase RlpA family protein [Deltaproteobacteria bacterium]MBN2671933.1 septal ring lytic transglycosylase RlpA family protein [Deltaproteobacteria bacterium]
MFRPILKYGLLLPFLITAQLVSVSACAGSYKAGTTLTGIAAYYADKLHGRATASGELYDKTKLTAAHKTLPFGTTVKVTNVSNMKTVIVRVNDRGPFGDRKRIIDLSREAAERIDMIRQGITEVEVEILELPAAK